MIGLQGLAVTLLIGHSYELSVEVAAQKALRSSVEHFTAFGLCYDVYCAPEIFGPGNGV